jgi:hypothetical protein
VPFRRTTTSGIESSEPACAPAGGRLPARTWPARHGRALGLFAYLLAAVAMLGRTWFGGHLGQRLVGGGGDPLGFVWFLAWLPHAVANGQSPFFTTALMAPGGANLLNSASIPLPSLLLWPLTAIGGPDLSYDVLVTLGLGLSAWAAFIALCRVTRHRGSAWIGGAVYGFGGYMAGQATAHANLLIAVFPPVAAMLADDVRHTRRPWRTGALVGCCAAAQLYVDEEILATTVIMALVAAIVICLSARPARATVARYARAAFAAATVFALIAGPAVAYQLFGDQHVRGRLVTAGRYVNDLASFVVPSSVNLLSTAGSRHLTGGFSGYDGESGAYLGVPLLLLLLFAAWRLRRRALLLVVLGIAAAVFSLGPHLRVLGHDTGVLLPWVIPNHLPLLENAVPDRFNLYVWLAAAALLALAIDEFVVRPPLGSRLLAVVVVGAALVAILPAPTPTEVVKTPPVLTSAVVLRRYVPPGSTVLIEPSTDGQVGMYAQARSGFAYRIPDGGVFVPNDDGVSYGMRQGPLLYAVAALGGVASTRAGRTSEDARCLAALASDPAPRGGCRAHYRDAIAVLGVNAVVVLDRGGRSEVGRYTRFFAALLGPPARASGARVFVVRS